MIQKDPQIDDLSSLSVKHDEIDEKLRSDVQLWDHFAGYWATAGMKHRVTQPTKQLLNIHYKS